MRPEPLQRAARPFVSGGAASVAARLSVAGSMVVGLVVGLVLAVVCALLVLALNIVASLGRAARDSVERLRSGRWGDAQRPTHRAEATGLPGDSAPPARARNDARQVAAVAERHPTCEGSSLQPTLK